MPEILGNTKISETGLNYMNYNRTEPSNLLKVVASSPR